MVRSNLIRVGSSERRFLFCRLLLVLYFNFVCDIIPVGLRLPMASLLSSYISFVSLDTILIAPLTSASGINRNHLSQDIWAPVR